MVQTSVRGGSEDERNEERGNADDRVGSHISSHHRATMQYDPVGVTRQ